MKTPILAAVLGASLLALPVAAQTTTAPAPAGAAAATLPNAFEEAPAAAPTRRAAVPPAPTSVAPDIARSETALRAAIASLTITTSWPSSVSCASKLRPARNGMPIAAK